MTRSLRSRWPMSAAALAAALALALTSCRTVHEVRPPLSPDAVVLDLPLARQDELYECGLAALSSLCLHYGVDIPPAERARLAQLALESKGLSGDELRAALEQLGFETFLYSSSLDHSPTGLYHHVDTGHPVLVMTSSRRGGPHYSLFLGYDPAPRLVALLDPARGWVLRPAEVFDADWERCQRFALLATLPGAVSTPAKESTE